MLEEPLSGTANTLKPMDSNFLFFFTLEIATLDLGLDSAIPYIFDLWSGREGCGIELATISGIFLFD